MSDALLIWWGIFAAITAAYLVILYREKDRKLYLLYALFGMAFGFYMDLFSFMSGYYSYPAFFPDTILGLPFSMTLAEGFSVAITIWAFELLRELYTKTKAKR